MTHPSTRADLSGALLGRGLLVLSVEANGATDGSLRDAEFLRELPLGLQALAQRLPGEIPSMACKNDLNLVVREDLRGRPIALFMIGSSSADAGDVACATGASRRVAAVAGRGFARLQARPSAAARRTGRQEPA